MSRLHDVVDELSVRLDAPVGVSDLTFASIAAGPHPLDVDWVRRESLIGRVAPKASLDYYAARGVVPSMTGPLYTDDDPEFGASARWILPITRSGRTYGYVWIIDAQHRISRAEIEAIAPFVVQLGELMHRRTVRLRDRASSVRDLLVSSRKGLRETASWLYDVAGYPQGQVAVMVLTVASEVGRQLPVGVLDGPFPRVVPGEVWRFVDKRRAVLLLPPETVRRTDAIRRVAEHALEVTESELDRSGAVSVGIGDVVGSLYEAPASFRQARLAVRAQAAFEELPRITAWKDLGAMRAVVSIPEEHLPDAIPPGVARLRGDAPFIAQTLATYFATGGNVRETCERLSISRGTVYYRLQRAEAITGLSLKDGADRLTLEVGLAVLRLHESAEPRTADGKDQGVGALAR
jgi:hypothetical protein